MQGLDGLEGSPTAERPRAHFGMGGDASQFADRSGRPYTVCAFVCPRRVRRVLRSPARAPIRCCADPHCAHHVRFRAGRFFSIAPPRRHLWRTQLSLEDALGGEGLDVLGKRARAPSRDLTGNPALQLPDGRMPTGPSGLGVGYPADRLSYLPMATGPYRSTSVHSVESTLSNQIDRHTVDDDDDFDLGSGLLRRSPPHKKGPASLPAAAPTLHRRAFSEGAQQYDDHDRWQRGAAVYASQPYPSELLNDSLDGVRAPPRCAVPCPRHRATGPRGLEMMPCALVRDCARMCYAAWAERWEGCSRSTSTPACRRAHCGCAPAARPAHLHVLTSTPIRRVRPPPARLLAPTWACARRTSGVWTTTILRPRAPARRRLRGRAPRTKSSRRQSRGSAASGGSCRRCCRGARTTRCATGGTGLSARASGATRWRAGGMARLAIARRARMLRHRRQLHCRHLARATRAVRATSAAAAASRREGTSARSRSRATSSFTSRRRARCVSSTSSRCALPPHLTILALWLPQPRACALSHAR